MAHFKKGKGQIVPPQLIVLWDEAPLPTRDQAIKLSPKAAKTLKKRIRESTFFKLRCRANAWRIFFC